MSEKLSSFQEECYDIITDDHLTVEQKARSLSLAAENHLPYPDVDDETAQALADGCICDMFEGHAIYKPRYVLPDYARFLQQGSAYLELKPAQDFDDALMQLMIIYHHVPSVTGLPVFLGYLDKLLMPYVGDLTEHQLYQKLKHFWIYLDRTLPDAFMHANIGPEDSLICRLILKIDAELKQVAPNLTFMYHPDKTPEDLLLLAAESICECSKPHIANAPLHDDYFDEQGFGIVSCYNSLPIAGGGSTLCRLNLFEIAKRSANTAEFMAETLPYYCQRLHHLLQARLHFLFEKSCFFDESFLVAEGLIDPGRFAAMFGMFGMAEAVNLLMEKEGHSARYGKDDVANQLAVSISQQLSEFVECTPLIHSWRNRAITHAQSGISCDVGTSPGARIPYGQEPDPVTHLMIVAPHHRYYHSGISDILTIDETIKQNPQSLMQLCLGAFSLGMREFTATISGHDLIRITGYMVRLSDVEKFKREGSRLNTTFFGSEAVDNNRILERTPRVVSREQCMGKR